MKVAIEVHDSGVAAAFARMLAAGQNPRPALSAIGNALVQSTKLRFIDSQAPDGSTWRPLSAVTIALRRKGRGSGGAKPLLDTGRLRNSITSRADSRSVTVGTNVVYAAMQHFGAKMGEFGRYSQVGRVRRFGIRTFKGSAGTQKGFPIPWGDVPARPFLGISRDDRTEILGILRERILGP